MTDKNILHMLTPLRHISPFDVNMALDAGFDAVVPYTEVTPGEVPGLVQDAMFSRPPKVGARTAFFFGGKQVLAALDALDAAKQALVPPFGVSCFADPAGSFTTAAAMVACVEKLLRAKKQREFRGARVAIFGGTGVVGFSSAVIAALEGADVTLVGYDGIGRVRDASAEIEARFGVKMGAADGSDEAKKGAILAQSEVALCAGRAGVTILARTQIEAARRLLAVADVNAVPPAGVEGLELTANGAELNARGVLGVGPLTIGSLKYRIESSLFKKMIEAAKPVSFDFRDAFALARSLNE